MKTKCIIVDDEHLARTLLKEYLLSIEDIEVMAEAQNGYEGIKLIQEHQPELIFLDINMPKLTGFEMLELIDTPPSVIFTTAFDEFALKAFDANAIDYLLKPYTEERLQKAVKKYLNGNGSAYANGSIEKAAKELNNNRIVVKDNSQIHIIPHEDILFFAAADDYVKIHTNQKYYIKKSTMSYYEDLLDDKDFCRVHRSYLVHIKHIQKMEPYEKDGAVLIMKNGAQIPVSKAGYKKIKEELGMS